MPNLRDPKTNALVKLAAETGGNCQATVPGKLVVKDGVTIIGKGTRHGINRVLILLAQVILTLLHGCRHSRRFSTQIISPSFFYLSVKGTTTPLI